MCYLSYLSEYQGRNKRGKTNRGRGAPRGRGGPPFRGSLRGGMRGGPGPLAGVESPGEVDHQEAAELACCLPDSL